MGDKDSQMQRKSPTVGRKTAEPAGAKPLNKHYHEVEGLYSSDGACGGRGVKTRSDPAAKLPKVAGSFALWARTKVRSPQMGLEAVGP